MAPEQTGHEIFTIFLPVSHRSSSNPQSSVSRSGFWHPKGGITNLKKSSAVLQLQTLLQAGKERGAEQGRRNQSLWNEGHSTCPCLASQRQSCESHQQPCREHIKLLRELRSPILICLSHAFVESPCPYQPSDTEEIHLLILQGDSSAGTEVRSHLIWEETLEIWTKCLQKLSLLILFIKGVSHSLNYSVHSDASFGIEYQWPSIFVALKNKICLSTRIICTIL